MAGIEHARGPLARPARGAGGRRDARNCVTDVLGIAKNTKRSSTRLKESLHSSMDRHAVSSCSSRSSGPRARPTIETRHSSRCSASCTTAARRRSSSTRPSTAPRCHPRRVRRADCRRSASSASQVPSRAGGRLLRRRPALEMPQGARDQKDAGAERRMRRTAHAIRDVLPPRAGTSSRRSCTHLLVALALRHLRAPRRGTTRDPRLKRQVRRSTASCRRLAASPTPRRRRPSGRRTASGASPTSTSSSRS